MPPEWTVIIPVKPLDRAKSRLVPGRGDSAAVAFAFFQDALAAVSASESVRATVVATSDPLVAAWARDHGAAVVDDSAADGINAAAAHAARWVGADAHVAIVVSDLPCLTPAALDAVLSLAASEDRAFVRDAAGTGTTIWTSSTGVVASRFGPASAAAHLADGDADLVSAGDPDGLAPARRDVDTRDDLASARALGVGPRTAALLVVALLVTVAEESAVGPDVVVPVVDESGHWHHVPGPVLAGAGFRLVRAGQRLVVELDPTGSTVSARIP